MSKELDLCLHLYPLPTEMICGCGRLHPCAPSHNLHYGLPRITLPNMPVLTIPALISLPLTHPLSWCLHFAPVFDLLQNYWVVE